MNGKLDKIRRRTAKEVDEKQKNLLKNQRFLFLRNVEDLEPDAKQLPDNLRKFFIENNLHGITAYWTTNALSHAGMEGFNNKVRWLIR